MKIIDYAVKGNVVRFYLGEKTPEWGWTKPDYKDEDGKTPTWLQPCDTYCGDDWDDTPYEHNAGRVYDEFIKGYKDIAFPFDTLVLEPADGILNSRYCKNDMKNRGVPCIIAISKEIQDKVLHSDANSYYGYLYEFDYWVGCDAIEIFYFGDDLEPDVKLI